MILTIDIFLNIHNKRDYGCNLILFENITNNKMSRSVPWRNKPTPLIVQMIPVAAEMKLYLVN